MQGITHVPLHHKRPAFALFSACHLRQQTEKHCRGLGFRCPVFVCEARPSSLCSFKKIRTNISYLFHLRLKVIVLYFKTDQHDTSPSLPPRRESFWKNLRHSPLLWHNQSELIPQTHRHVFWRSHAPGRYVCEVPGVFVPKKISGVGTIFGLLVHVL
jgi:hypothetical protein